MVYPPNGACISNGVTRQNGHICSDDRRLKNSSSFNMETSMASRYLIRIGSRVFESGHAGKATNHPLI